MDNQFDFSDNVFNDPNLPNAVNQPQQPPITHMPGQNQVSEEMLDAMINNPNEHEQVKQQARDLKAKLFPQVAPQHQPVEQPQPSQVQPEFPTQQVVYPQVQQGIVIPPEQGVRQASGQDISNLLGALNSNLYTSEVNLLSDPSTTAKLRSMTVQEYKFLSKQLEIFENTIRNMSKSDQKSKWKFDLCEMRLTNSLNTVLQNCVDKNTKLPELSFFDWVYLLLVLKQISRGSTTSWEVKCSQKECDASIPVSTADIIERMQNLERDVFKTPFCEVECSGITLLLSVISRADMEYMEKFISKNKDYTLDTCTIANLNLGVMEEIVNATKDHMARFTETFGVVVCQKCGKEVKINVSDFFLSFFVL
jgi:hypothetical protein